MLSRLELKRQLFHMVQGSLLVLLLYFGILSPLSLFLLIVIGFIISFFVKWGYPVPLFSWCLDHFERTHEKKRFPGKGMLFLFIGSLLAIKLFDTNIALASIMVLTLGDSVSHLFGAKFGKLKNIFNWRSNKWYEGTLAGIVAGFLGAVIFVPIIEAFLAAFVAMVFEVVKIDFNDLSLDDNLVVPLVAGTSIVLFQIFF